MHCPRCGTVATKGQQFCRSCGFNLEQVAALLDSPVATHETAGDNEIAQLKELQRKHESWGVIAGLITFGVILALLITIVVVAMILKGGLLIIPGTFLILLAVGAGVMGYFQASAKLLKQKLAEPQLLSSTNDLPKSIDSPIFTSPVSVTEQTTQLLEDQDNRSTNELAS